MLSEIAQQKILQHLYLEEDYRQFSYDDATAEEVKAPEGNLTIGIGWNIQVNGCPREIAEFAAMYFVKQADAQLSKKLVFYNELDDVRKVVLCDMAFNLGIEGELHFTQTLNAVQKKDWRTAAICMLQSDWAKRVGKRAITLSQMMETGQWT